MKLVFSFLLFYHLFDEELGLFHFARRSNLATASWKYSIPVDEHAVDANLSLPANRDAWWWAAVRI